MPHLPDLSSHAGHDPELVAAYAAGDATGDALATATALVAGCPECGALHRDLRAISAATSVLPAPARPRDFRLTPEQAASLRPAGLRGLLATLAGPRFGFAAPLGSAMATLGLVGILVAGGGLPLGAGGATSGDTAYLAAPAPTAGPTVASESLAAGAPEASEAPAAVNAAPASAAPAASAPATAQPATDDRAAGSPAPQVDTAAGGATPSPPAGDERAAYASPPASPGAGAGQGGNAGGLPEAGAEQAGPTAEPPAAAIDGGSGTPWLPAAVALLVGGLVLLAVRLGSRRLAP